jgi:hypothetical protein
MFPLIGALATFAGSTATFALIDLLISLLGRRGGRQAVGTLARKAMGKPIGTTAGGAIANNPSMARRFVKKAATRGAKLGAGFGGIEVALEALGHRGGGAGPDALSELTRARAFLNPTRVAGGADELENMLALLMQQQGGRPAAGVGLPFS